MCYKHQTFAGPIKSCIHDDASGEKDFIPRPHDAKSYLIVAAKNQSWSCEARQMHLGTPSLMQRLNKKLEVNKISRLALIATFVVT